MLERAQLRAARALLDWRQEQLADAARVGIATIQRLERGQGTVTGNVATVMRIKAALEQAGVLFLEADLGGGTGVRLNR